MKSAFSIVLVCFCLSMALPVQAVASVTDEVKRVVDEVVRIVGDPELKKPQKEPQRRQALRNTISSIFDYQEMAQRSLATHWKVRTPAERSEFISLFQTLLENSYAGKIEGYRNEKIVYLKESVDGQHAEVKSKVIVPKGDEYSLDYRLAQKGGKWMVYDVVIEGVSLVSNYRGQFNRIVNNQGYPALVKKLRTKSEEIKAP
ncbi:MAG: organic solvent tolerance ABC transporter substrate-binding protein [Geobacteraceae bacterium GWC2_58_44]|nr:MAG: organic solvent tolerance ABC transporter substrate-binding protein [Geobacteraceae bacterium GWC2_58_44]HBG08322.1 organic solvent tolerance ABC transporter substrate-binding protein [Geobacter sp.]